MDQQSSQQERLTETAQRFAEMFAEYPVATSSNSAEDINATGRFNVRNYGSRRIILSADDTEDLQDDNEGTPGRILSLFYYYDTSKYSK